MKQIVILTALFVSLTRIGFSQCSGWTNLQTRDSVFTNPAFGNATTPEKDKLHRPYVYLAEVGGGLKIYDVTPSATPTVVTTIPTTVFDTLSVINLYQDSIWLYISLGTIWDTTEFTGMAIVDVSNPATPVLLDTFIYQGPPRGAGAVVTRGNYAYLCGQENGLIILDISNKSNIQFVSELPFDNSFPHNPQGVVTMYNARGIDLKGNYAYVCYDKGGLRVVDISNVNNPVQVSQYCNPDLVNMATAYNNVVINDTLAYVAIDYYGMEVLNISDPMNVTMVAHWHPSTWAPPTNNYTTWANSKGHANEIAYDANCSKVYLAAGRSDAVSVDVSDPFNPQTCEIFGSDSDAYGTWGLDFFDNKLYIAYIWSTVFPPFSNYTGFKELLVSCTSASIKEITSSSNIILYPNPARELLYIEIPEEMQGGSVAVFDVHGRKIYSSDISGTKQKMELNDLAGGMYFVRLSKDGITKCIKLMVD